MYWSPAYDSGDIGSAAAQKVVPLGTNEVLGAAEALQSAEDCTNHQQWTIFGLAMPFVAFRLSTTNWDSSTILL